MYTSCFKNIKKLKSLGYSNFVSIAGKCPDYYHGKEYKKLAPKYYWWKQWHDENLSNDWYKEQYFNTVLNVLDPVQVFKDVGDDAVLLCWESPGHFCHRRLVAQWFKSRLNIDVIEIKL